MKCPYRKITTHKRTPFKSEINEDYAACYGTECPLFIQGQQFEACIRADSESFTVGKQER